MSITNLLPMIRPSILLATLVLSSAPMAQTTEGAATIFRYAQFGPDWIVTLGQPLNAPFEALDSGAVVQHEPGVYKLGSYESYGFGPVPIIVTIRTDLDGMVTSLRFDYGFGFDFSNELASYTELLGEPDERRSSLDGETATWEDGMTRFELVREVIPEGERWYSLLSEAETRL